ncbi:MAG: hypothetical protein RLO22_18835 [Sneathiellaceae bacterium]
MGADDDLRRELLQTALRDPAALERALQLAEHAYGWLGDPGSEAGAGLVETLALPAPARSGAVPDPAPPQRQRRPRRAKQAAPAEGGEAARAGSTWTEAEEDTLRQLYPGGAPQEDILAALPGRSWGTIGVRASKLGLHRPRGGAVPKSCRSSPRRARPPDGSPTRGSPRSRPTSTGSSGVTTAARMPSS